ncbi:4692_t:CDS:2, partial [Ambispora leptoticha]
MFLLKKTLFAGLAFLAINTFRFVKADEQPSDVISLTKDTFHSIVDPENVILVEFFAPWCGHCKALAKVDCTAESELCQEHEIRGYPTLKVFRDGNATDYTGGRKEDSIISYMKKQTLPAISDVTVENLDTFKDSENVVIVGFFTADSQEEYNTFAKVAEANRDSDFVFGATGQKEAADKEDLKPPVIVLYKNFDERNATLYPPFDEEKLSTFIKTNSIPLLAEIGPENYAAYVDSGLPLAFLFYENDEQRTTLGKEIEPIALETKGKVNFVYIDAVKYGSHAQNINLKEVWPAFGIQKPEEGLKYPYDQSKEITTENIRAFIEKFLKDEIPPS